MKVARRFRQGIRALLAFARPVDLNLVRSVLDEAHVDLFQRMQRSEQHHGVNVLRTLMEEGETIPHDLVVAALLHDVGKSRCPVRVWQKTLTVLVRRFIPRLYWDWSRYGSTSSPFARACIVAERHPRWSMELAQAVGASERALWLIEHHADDLMIWINHLHFPLLARLRQADDAN